MATGVHLSKVQLSARKAQVAASAFRQALHLVKDFVDFHNANQGGEYGSGGSIYDPGDPERDAQLAAELDDAEGFIRETGISRADHAAMVALGFDLFINDPFATEFRTSLCQRIGG